MTTIPTWGIPRVLRVGNYGLMKPIFAAVFLVLLWESFVTFSRLQDGSSGYHKITDGSESWYGSLGSLTSPFRTPRPLDAIEVPQKTDLGEQIRIAKVSILFGHPHPVYDRAFRSHEAHNRRHGYYFHLLREQMLDDVWTKPAYLLKLVLAELAKPESQRLKWLFWVDADTVLMNTKMPIEVFLPPEDDLIFKDVHMLVTHDWNGLNNGVFPIRVNAWAAEMLASVLAYRHYRPDAPLVFRDQSAMDEVLKMRRFAASVVQVPQRWFNAYQNEPDQALQTWQVRPGDLLVHFPGGGDREERMRKWLDKYDHHLPEWEMEPSMTPLPGEVAEFWAGIKREKEKLHTAFEDTINKFREAIVEMENLIKEYGPKLPEDRLKAIGDEVAKAKRLLDTHVEIEQDLHSIINGLAKFKEACKALYDERDKVRNPVIKAAIEYIGECDKLMLVIGEHLELDLELRNLKNRIMDLQEEVGRPESTVSAIQSKTEAVKLAREAYESKGAKYKDIKPPPGVEDENIEPKTGEQEGHH